MAIIFVENSVGPLFPLLADAPRPRPASFRRVPSRRPAPSPAAPRPSSVSGIVAVVR